MTTLEIVLPNRSFERLVALKERTEAVSIEEVIKNALRLYESMIDERDAGHEILVRDKDGNTLNYRIFA
ncbi:MAG: hypothetical protein H7840_08915 [Alphaproteobacteria bacterium]